MSWFLLALLGCPKPQPTLTETAPPTDVPPTDTDTDTDPPSVEPFGLDARPANPSCVAPTEGPLQDADVTLTRAYDSVFLGNPVGFSLAPGDVDHWYVIEQGGTVKRFDGSQAAPVATTVLQLIDIESGGEKGLLGLAFAPDFATSGQVYLSYNAQQNGLKSRLSRFQTTDNGASWDLSSEEVLMTVDQPYDNHNGGHIAFGPDGMLYWGLGDGGSAGDPDNHAQRTDSVLGAMLRLDVSGPTLSIPPDNPFVDVPGARQELYAIGLRNPWRWSFDPVTGDLWLGDVGQSAYEEVDRIEAGGNYGWRIREGASCYPSDPCETAGLIDPIVDYAIGAGRSVVGGVVYRGSALPTLVGTYLFSDFFDGNIYAVRYDGNGDPFMEVLVGSSLNPTHFAHDAEGEVWVLDRSGGGLYRLDPATPGAVDTFPQTLSATGCFEADGDPLAPLIPYSLNHPFWSDGAEKTRWLAIPDGTTIGVDPTGDLEFPVGTVLAKSFHLNGVPTETRLFMQHQTDVWAGYAYKWRSDGSDADLLLGADAVQAGPDIWNIPDRSSCVRCHTRAAGFALGLELGQLDKMQTYPSTGRVSPQLDTLDHIGLFTAAPGPVNAWPALEDSSADLDDRARTYLHVNCSSCHQPDGPAVGDLDLRRPTPLASTGLCAPAIQGDVGLLDPQVVQPGDPANSVLWVRMQDEGAYRMPPIATNQIDEAGVDVIGQWITGLSCP